jgi:hypothetical protein
MCALKKEEAFYVYENTFEHGYSLEVHSLEA